MNLDERFNIAAVLVRGLVHNVNSDNFFQLYAYFKQSREGNVAFERPSLLNIRGRNMWDAWKSKENMSKEDAMTKYIHLAYDLTNNKDLLE